MLHGMCLIFAVSLDHEEFRRQAFSLLQDCASPLMVKVTGCTKHEPRSKHNFLSGYVIVERLLTCFRIDQHSKAFIYDDS